MPADAVAIAEKSAFTWALSVKIFRRSCAATRSCRRKQREQKRYAKQVMAERVKEKAQAKKAGVASITKLRKQRQRDGFAGELDLDAELAGPRQGRKPAMSPGQRIRPGRLWRRTLPQSLSCRCTAG